MHPCHIQKPNCTCRSWFVACYVAAGGWQPLTTCSRCVGLCFSSYFFVYIDFLLLLFVPPQTTIPKKISSLVRGGSISHHAVEGITRKRQQREPYVSTSAPAIPNGPSCTYLVALRWFMSRCKQLVSASPMCMLGGGICRERGHCSDSFKDALSLKCSP